MGGYAFDRGTAIVTDKSGNIYSTGVLSDTADFDPGAGVFNLNCPGIGAYVQKLDANGNFVWAKSITNVGSLYLCEAYAMTIDNYDNIIITGKFANTVDFDPGIGIDTATAVGLDDVFILKLDTAGNFIWAKTFGGSGNDIAYSIASDSLGNIYTTGYFSHTVDFDPSSNIANLTSVDSNDIFIQKLDSDGNFIWAKSIGSINDDQGLSLKANNEGDVFVTGFFSGSMDFDPGPSTYVINPGGVKEIFVLKLNTSGDFVWAKHMNGGFSSANSIALDKQGSIFLAGHFGGLVDFDPDTSLFVINGIGSAVFLQKLNSLGNLDWVKTNNIDDGYYALATDDTGNIYAIGFFSGMIDFDPDSVNTYYLYTQLPGESWGVFIQKLDSSGGFLWAKSMAGEIFQSAAGKAIIVDDSGYVYTTGSFNYTSDFDGGPGVYYLTSLGSENPFIAKISQQPCVLPPAPNIIYGDTSVCKGSHQIYFINAVSGANSYTWTTSPYIYLYGLDTVTNFYAPNASSVTINVVANNNCGSSIQSSSLTININPLPDPIIVQYDSTLKCTNSFSSYQWYYNNSIIAGAVYDSVVATQIGLYYVSVTDSNTTCSDTSNHIVFDPLSTETINFEKAIKVYPNPSNGIFKIETKIQNVSYSVTDVTGKCILQDKLRKPICSIDLSHYSAGVYFLKVGEKVFKLIKT